MSAPESTKCVLPQKDFPDCGKEYRRTNAARHRKSCARELISCPECNYSNYKQQETSFHSGKKHVESTKSVSPEKKAPSYYFFSTSYHCKKDYGLKAKKRSDSVADLNKIWEKGADSDQLRDELIPCQNFITDIMVEMDATKYVISTFELNPYLVDKKLDQVIEKLDS